MGDVERMMTKR